MIVISIKKCISEETVWVMLPEEKFVCVYNFRVVLKTFLVCAVLVSRDTKDEDFGPRPVKPFDNNLVIP